MSTHDLFCIFGMEHYSARSRCRLVFDFYQWQLPISSDFNGNDREYYVVYSDPFSSYFWFLCISSLSSVLTALHVPSLAACSRALGTTNTWPRPLCTPSRCGQCHVTSHWLCGGVAHPNTIRFRVFVWFVCGEGVRARLLAGCCPPKNLPALFRIRPLYCLIPRLLVDIMLMIIGEGPNPSWELWYPHFWWVSWAEL